MAKKQMAITEEEYEKDLSRNYQLGLVSMREAFVERVDELAAFYFRKRKDETANAMRGFADELKREALAARADFNEHFNAPK